MGVLKIMKKLVVLAVSVLATAAASAPAATTTMAITHSGYVPKTLTIATGDSVVFANQDTAAHQVVLKPTTGFACTAGLVIQPGQSSTCTFRTVTKYAVSDPNHKTGAAFKGTITVTAGPPGSVLSLSATPKSVRYGSRSTLSGQLATGLANQKIDIFAKECGAAAFTKLGTATTIADGMYTFAVQPRKNTTYEARFHALSSTQQLVKVRPRVTLRKLAPRRFRVTVLAADSYAGKVVLFQRYSSTQRRWIRVRAVVLAAGGTLTTPINPTSVSKAVFRSKLRARLRVRALLTQAQAGSCYAGSASPTIRS